MVKLTSPPLEPFAIAVATSKRSWTRGSMVGLVKSGVVKAVITIGVLIFVTVQSTILQRASGTTFAGYDEDSWKLQGSRLPLGRSKNLTNGSIAEHNDDVLGANYDDTSVNSTARLQPKPEPQEATDDTRDRAAASFVSAMSNSSNSSPQPPSVSLPQRSRPARRRGRAGPRHTIFYNVYVPLVNKTKLKTMPAKSLSSPPSSRRFNNPSDAAEIIHEQLQQIHNNATSARAELYRHQHRTVLYYNSIGQNTTLECPPGMDCRFMHHYDNAFEEVTLTALFQYCQQNPNHLVTYLHNKGSFHDHEGNHILRRLATRSSLSSACFRMDRRNCNTCGMTFKKYPHFHFSSNMWSAKCSYVRNLIPPHDYAAKRLELCSTKANTTIVYYADDSQLSLCEVLVDPTKVAEAEQANGLNRFAMEFWISSHPSNVPCHANVVNPTKFFTGWETWWQPRLYQAGRAHGSAKMAHIKKYIQRHVSQTQHLYPNNTEDIRDTLCGHYIQMLPPHPCQGIVPNYTAPPHPQA